MGTPARAAAEERKVVTVLFADLVGFTGRAERLDPEDVRRMLSPYYARLRSELERFGGTVEKFIGDAVMALFGAPIAHEDDPERAVRAALAIRDAMVELNDAAPALDLHVRIAVNTGEAVVSVGARATEGESVAAGDVVNTCARLQTAAPVDGVLVGETTYRATERVIEYREAEPVIAKGKVEPIPVWEAVAPRASLGIDVVQRSRAPLVGRQEELDLLVDALARARRERSPQLVTLIGVPGIGKSRLVHELLDAVDADPELIFWRQGRSLPYGEGVTYWALAEMVKAQAGIFETDGPETAGEKLRSTTAGLVGEPGDARWVEGHLRPLVGLGSDEELRGDRRGEAFGAWRRFFEALAERSPLVLVFEDLHWADNGLLDFVDHLVDWASAVPLLVVCTARPELLERRPGWGGGKRDAATLSLSPLTADETARLVAALLERAALPAETQVALLARAGGNPLYAEEYVRMLRDRPSAQELALPETVQGIIAARLDGLPQEEKALLQDAAVVGKVVWAGALATIGGVPRWQVEDRLHALERKEFVQRARRSSVASETEYAFRHVLVRDVAYGQIPRARRGEKHRLTAEWIESLGRPEDHAEMLAHHYLAALELARAAGEDLSALAEPARTALREAGDRAAALSAFSAAMRFYGSALELWPPDDLERPRLLLRLGESQHSADATTGWYVLAEARDGLDALGDREGAAEAEALLGDILWREGQQERAFERLEAAVSLLSDAPPSAAKAYVVQELSRLLMLAGRNDEAIRLGREALEMARALRLEVIEAHALNNIGTARVSSGDVGGLADLERSAELAEAANAGGALSRARINLASVLCDLGELERAWELHSLSEQAAQRLDTAEAVRWVNTEIANDLYWAGRWDEALERANEAIAESEQGKPHYQELQARCLRMLIQLARADVAAAVLDVERQLAFARAARDPQALIPALAVVARVLAAAGRRDEALEVARELLLEWERLESGYGVSWLVPLWRVAPELGLVPRCVELVARGRIHGKWHVASLAYLREDFTRAAEVFAEIGSHPDEADARLRAAEALIAAGRRPEGEVELRRVLAFFRQVGASAHVRQAEALLAASA